MKSALTAAVRRSLRETFGIAELRAGQQEVISRVLAGRDTLAIMPTGAGKSLCYQLPALHLEGATLVVSPLIALMKDQAERLAEAGVAAEQLNSARTQNEQDESMARIAGQDSEIVFATPERLADPGFLAALQARRVALLVVDEAHCISQWGHDFRPAYLELGHALKSLGDPPVLALTATAPSEVVEDIRMRLGRPGLEVVNTGLYRPNLRLQVTQVTNDDEHARRLVETVRHARGSGIVYCATVKGCEAAHERLAAEGESSTLYHGRLPVTRRNESQDRFMRGEARVMVATNAFGMGIDKPDIRFVVHHQMPGSPQAYYQEAGRSGRDGEEADCVLLFHRKDRQVQQFFLAKKYPDAAELARVLDAMGAPPSLASVAELQGRLGALPKGRLTVILALLRDGGRARSDRQRRWQRIERKDEDELRRQVALEALAQTHAGKADRDQEALERMVFYAQTGFCRWRVLLEAFGEAIPFDRQCGHCDNCLRPVPRPPPARDPLRRPARRRLPAPLFAPGERVQVPRFGDGLVREATAHEVTVVFADGAERTFVAQYVKRRPA